MTLDHETRANRFLGAFASVRDMLAYAAPGFSPDAAELANLLDMLNDEAKRVVTPFRASANDDGDDDP